MSIEEKLKIAEKAFAALDKAPQYTKGRIIGYVEGLQAQTGEDYKAAQAQEKQQVENIKQ